MTPGSLPFRYRDLMPFQVRDILMVASRYDSFVLEEDGRFSDRLLGQYMTFDLSSPPHIHHAITGKDALSRLALRNFDMVLMTPHASDMSPTKLAAKIRDLYPQIPIVMLTYEQADAESYAQVANTCGMSEVFLWAGDPRLLIAMVKVIEDRMNAEHDTKRGAVRVILVVEDSPYFYSAFLPGIYSEILVQVDSLLPEWLNERDRHYRMQTRPKILLARNFEEAEACVSKFAGYLLGVITDLRFKRRGKFSRHAGLRLAAAIRKKHRDLPILVQSSDESVLPKVADLHAHFVNKRSPDLIREIREYMKQNFGFGPFVFRTADGTYMGEAQDISDLIHALEKIPEDSLIFHATGNHFSNWLMARSEFEFANALRPVKVSDFKDTTGLRNHLVERMKAFIEQRQRGQITDLRDSTRLLERDFTRIGTGSIGGKARGIAFVSHWLANATIHEDYPECKIMVPRTAVLGTDYFERFVERDGLRERAVAESADRKVLAMFMEQELEDEVLEVLNRIVNEIHYPLAVRSSGLHEDSQLQPLAGLYSTYLLPNEGGIDRRLELLSRAVRSVYASCFFNNARTYLAANALRLEQEKMAVMIQRIVGARHGDRFYPNFAGVAQSHNYYPMRYIKAEDGIATVALGFGLTVVQGGKALRFCPRYPQILPQMSTPEDALRFSQREIVYLDLTRRPRLNVEGYLATGTLEEAEQDGTLEAVGATYSPENHVIYDTIYRKGSRIVNFAGILKHGRFPLAKLLSDLMDQFQSEMGSAVEMEFAVALRDPESRPEFAILQLRPLVTSGSEREVDLDKVTQKPIIKSDALGNGLFKRLNDIIMVEPKRTEFAQSREIAREIARFNHRLIKAHRSYILLGPGRWGTADPWLGIPVSWNQVSGARLIVEIATTQRIDPSQGSHFFHNLTALKVGYFSLDPRKKNQTIDWDWFAAQHVVKREGPIVHLRPKRELIALVDGRKGKGLVIERPEEEG